MTAMLLSDCWVSALLLPELLPVRSCKAGLLVMEGVWRWLYIHTALLPMLWAPRRLLMTVCALRGPLTLRCVAGLVYGVGSLP